MSDNKKYARCEGFRDLENLMLRQLERPKHKEEYAEALRVRQEVISKAPELWKELVKKNEKWFKQEGYLDIEYLSDKNTYRRKPLERGRPKKRETMGKRITIRLDAELEEILNKYCQTNNITESEAIRRAIDNLSYRY